MRIFGIKIWKSKWVSFKFDKYLGTGSIKELKSKSHVFTEFQKV